MVNDIADRARASVKYKLVPSGTAVVLSVWNVLSPLQYCKVVPAVMAFSLLLKVVQSLELNNPLTVAKAVGKLNVCTDPVEDIPKSVPAVPVAKV